MLVIGLRKFFSSLTEEIASLNTRVKQCYTLGKYNDALELANAALVKAQQLENGENIILTCKSNLALIQKTVGKYPEAIETFKDLFQEYQTRLGPFHQGTLTVRHNLAATYKAAGSPDQAIKVLSPLPDLSAETLQSFILVAAAYKDLNDLNSAKSILTQAEEFILSRFGKGNVISVNLLNTKGLILKANAEYELAEKCFLEALEIRKEWNGDSHPETIIIRHNLAELYLAWGNKEKSSDLMKENLKLMQDEIKR